MKKCNVQKTGYCVRNKWVEWDGRVIRISMNKLSGKLQWKQRLSG